MCGNVHILPPAHTLKILRNLMCGLSCFAVAISWISITAYAVAISWISSPSLYIQFLIISPQEFTHD